MVVRRPSSRARIALRVASITATRSTSIVFFQFSSGDSGHLGCPVRVENDANLSAIAEWATGPEARTPDLVYLTGEVGVGGGLIVAAGLSVWLLNWFFRIGVRGDRERDAEDRARDFYDAHGHWPDEPPPP